MKNSVRTAGHPMRGLVLAIAALIAVPRSAEASELAELRERLAAQTEAGDVASAVKTVAAIGATGEARAASVLVVAAAEAIDPQIYDACMNALAATKSEEAVDQLLRHLKSKNPSEATIAIEMLVRIRGFEEKRRKALVAAFLDLSRYPKTESAQALVLPWLEANGGRLWALRALIDMRLQLLKRRIADGRLFHNLVEALWKASGQEYTNAKDWENYWATRAAEAGAAKDEPDGSGRPGPEEGAGSVAGTGDGAGEEVVEPWVPGTSRTAVRRKAIPSFFGTEVRSARALFIIDVSASMLDVDPGQPTIDPPEPPPPPPEPSSGRTAVAKTPRRTARPEPDFGPAGRRTRIDRVKRQLYQMIDRYPEGRNFALIAFSSDVQVIVGATRGDRLQPIPMTTATRIDTLERILALKADGYTRTDLAFETAFRFEGIDTIYLLSDGYPQKDPNLGKLPIAERNRVTSKLMREILALISKKNRGEGRHWEIHTFGFPYAMLGDFLQVIAARNHGTYAAVK